MNKLAHTRVYLCGNLQYIAAKVAVSWRDDMKQFCDTLGVICMSPLDRVFSNFPRESPRLQAELKSKIASANYEPVHRKMKEIRRRDLSMVDHANFIVAVIDSSKPTFGSVEELVVAEKSNKPVFIVVKPSLKKIPLWLLGMFKPECFYENLNQVKSMLSALNAGWKRMDKKHWRVFSASHDMQNK